MKPNRQPVAKLCRDGRLELIHKIDLRPGDVIVNACRYELRNADGLQRQHSRIEATATVKPITAEEALGNYEWWQGESICGNCRHWQGQGSHGECRRRSPIFNGYFTCWPQTQVTASCGEFQSLRPKP